MNEKLALEQMDSIQYPPEDITVVECKTASDDTLQVKFRTNLTLFEESALVDFIVNGVFSKSGEYLPEYREIMTFISMMKYMSNIPLPFINGTEELDVARCDKWMRVLDLFGHFECSDLDPIHFLRNWFFRVDHVIDEKIDFKKQEHFSSLKSDLQKNYDEIQRLIGVMGEIGDNFTHINLGELAEEVKLLASKDEGEIVNSIIDIHSRREAKMGNSDENC